ncbi:MAG: hypothetical protein LBP80_02760 [Treponema sp.]|nr:hypothetical protein [Treponema sp.]
MINPPELVGFPQAGDSALPGYVRDILIRNFEQYSGMTVNNLGDTGEYYLEGTITRHSSTRYSIILTIKRMDNFDVMATATGYTYSLSDLQFGEPLNKATKELLTNPKLEVKLTADAKKALDKPLDTKSAEGQAAAAKARAAPIASIKREQNANIAEDLGYSLTEAGRQLSESARERFTTPEFSAPKFDALTFTPPTIRAFSTSTTGAALQADLARYRENQAANKAAIEEQQQYLLRQREDILNQWQNFLGEVGKRRQLLREEEQKLLQVQAKLEAELREGEALFHASPPFRILYDQEPKVEADLERGTANMRFQIATEPTSLKVLEVRIDNLLKLNKSFVNVNKAYEDVNTAMTARFAQVKTAMNTVKEAMTNVNAAGSALGQNYKVAPISADWTVPPGKAEYGTELTTSWPVDYPRTFSLTVSLLSIRDDGDTDVIERQSLSLTNNISWNGPLKPESASAWGSFNNVKIDDLPAEGFLTIWIETVNGIDAETAAVEGYIETIPDGARAAAIERGIAARVSSRRYWSDTKRLTSLGAAVGTAGATITPALLVSPKLTFSPFSTGFFEVGADLGLIPGNKKAIQDIGYFSIAPYLHANLLTTTRGGGFGLYVGIGGGASFSRYTYPSESHVDPVTVITPVFDSNIGALVIVSHSVFDLRWTVKTNFKGADHRFTLGYMYRFGYLAPRFGGKPADLTNRR